MTHPRLSEVIGFDESEGRLRVRLRSGSVAILDKDGRPVVVRDPVVQEAALSRTVECSSKAF
jgi:hypothetical protein